MISEQKLLGFIGILIGLLSTIISFYGQYTDSQTGFLLFLSLIGIVLLFFLSSWPIDYFKKKVRDINSNKSHLSKMQEDLNSLKERLNLKEQISDLTARISFMERTKMGNKKGQIDPRWYLILVMIILLILYMKEKGFI